MKRQTKHNTVEDMESFLKHKCIELNRVYRGTDHYGCINSGLEPSLRVVQKLDEHKKYYVIGPNIPARDFAIQLVQSKKFFKMGKHQYEGRDVYVYKTKTPAINKFINLVREIQNHNDSLRKRHIELFQEAK